jgi:antitoxin HicB
MNKKAGPRGQTRKGPKTGGHPPTDAPVVRPDRSLVEKAVRQVTESASEAIEGVIQAVARPLRVRVALYEDKENGGYTAVLTALPGCVAEGETRQEALASLREALEGHLLCRSGIFELFEGGVEEEVDL